LITYILYAKIILTDDHRYKWQEEIETGVSDGSSAQRPHCHHGRRHRFGLWCYSNCLTTATCRSFV